MADVGPERPRHAADVDAAVLVEALVLGRDDGLLHPRRDLLARDEHAALVAAEDVEDRVAVGRVDVAVDLLALLVERIESLELLADGHDEAVGEGGGRENAQHADEGEEAKLADPAGGRRLGALSAQQHGKREDSSPVARRRRGTGEGRCRWFSSAR